MCIPNLVSFILAHGIEVVSYDAESIVVNTQYSQDGKAITETETVKNDKQSVRDYLGY